MTSTTIRSDPTSSTVGRIRSAVLSLVVNPLGWRRHGRVHLTYEMTAPVVPLFGRWYLKATRDDTSADIELQVDRFSRRRFRIVHLDGMSRREVLDSNQCRALNAWVDSGDDGALMAAFGNA